MTEKDLRRLGAALPIPAPDEKAEAKALYLSLQALKNGHRETVPAPSSHFLRGPFSWALAGTLAIALIFLVVKTPSLSGSDQKSRILAEMEKVFEGRLEAVITRNGDTEIQLSEQEDVSNDQRLWIVLESNGVRTEVMTYSGCNFWVDSGGKRIKIEALAEAGGGILLVGDSFVWNSKEAPPLKGGFQIKATRLQPGNI